MRINHTATTTGTITEKDTTATSVAVDQSGTTTRDERMEQARALLEKGLQHVATDPETLGRYLRFRRHFHGYSRHNTLLILMQRPAARYCMGYRAWQKHGRQVRKGEKGLMIWAPLLRRPTDEEVAEGTDPDARLVRGYRVTFTFDYEQTDAVGEDALVYESPVPKLGTDGYAHLAGALERVAEHWGYEVTDTDGYAEGFCNWKRQVIGVRRELAPDDRAAVLAHELAHAAAHVPSKDGPKFTHAERELQAEGAAFLALYALGLDTSKAALPYLKTYADDDEALWAQLSAIEEIAGLLIEAVEEETHGRGR